MSQIENAELSPEIVLGEMTSSSVETRSVRGVGGIGSPKARFSRMASRGTW
jgi:hypothetical protein